MTKHHRIKGDYLHHGILADFAPRHLHVLVEDGKGWMMRDAFDTDPIGKAYGDPPMPVSADGDLLISGDVAFCPDPGELARIGLA